MFLWCGCHCGPDSASDPPSAIGSSIIGSIRSYSSGDPARPDPPDPPMPVLGCQSCQFGAAPAAYDMTWNYTGAVGNQHRPCCNVYTSQPTYRLYFRASAPGSTQCVWASSESIPYAAKQGLGGCFFPSSTGGRVVLAVPQTDLYGVLRMRIRISYAWDYNPNFPLGDVNQTAKPSDVFYSRINDNGTFWKPLDGAVPCLTTLTFKRENPQKIWNGTQIGFFGAVNGAPCQQALFSGFDMGLPDLLTITPVRT